jgi:malate dehydrogenase (oxaloacetate-decarboxylating)(NADP+)
MICGTVSTTHRHLHFIDQVIGKKECAKVYAAMNALVLPGRQIFLVDAHVNVDPTAEELAEITIMAADELRRFGIEPKIALLSHSNFGSSNAPSAQKMREVLAILQKRAPHLEVDGEMHGDLGLDANLCREALVDSTLEGDANLLVQPNINAANISYNLLKTAAGNYIATTPT